MYNGKYGIAIGTHFMQKAASNVGGSKGNVEETVVNALIEKSVVIPKKILLSLAPEFA